MVLPKINISVFGAKILLDPETPGISPDTPGLEHSGRNSGYKLGYFGFGSLRGKTPGIGPETPDLGVQILRKCCPGYSGYMPGYSGFLVSNMNGGECKTRFISFIFPCSVG